MSLRRYTKLDKFLISANQAFESIFAEQHSQRENPAQEIPDVVLTETERKHSAGLMRVNHTGEICAQALYQGQLLTAHSKFTQSMLTQAALEEQDHLSWTHKRLNELRSHRSYFNPLWYSGAFLLGFLAGCAGDSISLGFVEETEKQVGEHLQKHMDRLPNQDLKSRAIIKQMHTDEVKHGQSALAAGAQELPGFVKKLMHLQAKVMTSLAYWI